jgi:hypothetical protein
MSPERTAWLNTPDCSSDHSYTSASALVERKTPTLGSRRARFSAASRGVAKRRPPGLRGFITKNELQLSRMT